MEHHPPVAVVAVVAYSLVPVSQLQLLITQLLLDKEEAPVNLKGGKVVMVKIHLHFLSRHTVVEEEGVMLLDMLAKMAVLVVVRPLMVQVHKTEAQGHKDIMEDLRPALVLIPAVVAVVPEVMEVMDQAQPLAVVALV